MDVGQYLRDHRTDVLIFAILLILGVITRFLGISYQSLWIDEGATYYYSHLVLDEYLNAGEPNSPVYYLMQGYVIDALGHSEFAIRLLSAIAGALSVPLVYILSQKLFSNRYISVFTAALLLISPMAIEYSQEGRGYALMAFFFICQMIVLLHALEKDGWGYWILLSIISAVSFAMQYMSILATFTVYTYALFAMRKDIASKNLKGTVKAISSGILTLILCSPLLNYAYNAAKKSSSNEHWDWCPIGPSYVRELLTDVLFKIDFLILALVVILGAYLILKKDREKGYLLCWIVLVPAILTTLSSYMMNMTPRYVIWVYTGMYMMMSCSILALAGDDTKKLNRNAVVAGILVLSLVLISTVPYYSEITKTDYRGGCQALEENVQEGDLVLYAPPWENMVYGAIEFYFNPSDYGVTAERVSTNEELLSYIAGATGNVYVVIEQEYDPYTLLTESTSPNCQKIHEGYWITVWKITGPIA